MSCIQMLEEVMGVISGNSTNTVNSDDVTDLNLDIKVSAYIPDNYIE